MGIRLNRRELYADEFDSGNYESMRLKRRDSVDSVALAFGDATPYRRGYIGDSGRRRTRLFADLAGSVGAGRDRYDLRGGAFFVWLFEMNRRLRRRPIRTSQERGERRLRSAVDVNEGFGSTLEVGDARLNYTRNENYVAIR